MERKTPVKPSELSNLPRPQAAHYPAKFPMMSSCFPSAKRVHPNETVISNDNNNEKI